MFKSAPIAFQLLILLAPGNAGAEDDPKVSFNNHCRNCHSARPGDNRLGPSLYGIVGAQAGQVSGFHGYSGGFNGVVWTADMLNRLMMDPGSVSSSTTMIFPPVAASDERRKIIAYLQSLGGPQ